MRLEEGGETRVVRQSLTMKGQLVGYACVCAREIVVARRTGKRRGDTSSWPSANRARQASHQLARGLNAL